MAITISVMPPFTYPSISLRSQRVITVRYDLQMFLCPLNSEATRV
jgi:hypothetical protein